MKMNIDVLTAANINITITNRDILRDVSACFKPGLHYLIGSNGSGKTTFLKSILGIAKFKGSIDWNGQNLNTLSTRDLARLIAWLPQHPAWPAHLTVRDYVLLGRFPHLSWLGSYSQADFKLVDTLLQKLDHSISAGQHIGVLSGGERQQVALARALAQETPILLLDEPAQALDPANKLHLYKRLRAIAKEKTVICTTHDLEALEVDGATIHALKQGELLWSRESGLERTLLMEEVFN